MTRSSDTLLPPPDLKTKTSVDMSVLAEENIDRTTVGAVIPAYLEEKHIADVVHRSLEQLDNVLVVDDGSPDATAAAARSAGADVIVHSENAGKGESIKTGLRRWLERKFTYVVILDGDGQHRREAIERFLATASPP